MTFTRADLLNDISDKELTAISTKLVLDGQPLPLDAIIAEQVERVNDYAARYVVPDSVLKRFCRAFILWEVYKRLQEIPKKRQTAYDDALKELTAIRDGKFYSVYPARDLDPGVPQPAYSGKGRHGSRRPIWLR